MCRARGRSQSLPKWLACGQLRIGIDAQAALRACRSWIRSTLIGGSALGLALSAPALAAPDRSEMDAAYLAYREQVARGAYEAAYVHATRALELGQALYGASHETTAILQLNVGDLDMLRSRFEAARPHYVRALASLEKLKGERHLSLLIPLNDLARIYAKTGYFEQARQLHERALGIVETAYGAQHPAVANRLVTLGIFEELIRDESAARTRYERSLAIRRQIFPASHPDIAESLFFLAKLDLQTGNFEGAQTRYREAVAIWSSAPPRDSKIVTAARSQLRYAENKLGASIPAAASAVGPAEGESDTQPLLRAAPEYPSRALKRGIEGFVRLSFTVSADGRVRGAKVVESEPPGTFDQAALSALGKWQYKPRLEGGKPVARPGMEVVLRFVLPKD